MQFVYLKKFHEKRKISSQFLSKDYITELRLIFNNTEIKEKEISR